MDDLHETYRRRHASAIPFSDEVSIESNTMKTELKYTKGILLDKENKLKSRYHQVVERRVAGKEDIRFLFADLKEILAKKEREMLNRVDTSFGAVEDILSKCLSSVSTTKQIVSDVLLNVEGGRSHDTPVEEMKALLDDVKPNILFADQVLEYELVPEYRVNFEVKGKIEDLELDRFINHETANVEETNTNTDRNLREIAVESTDSRLQHNQKENTARVNENERDLAMHVPSQYGATGFSNETNIEPTAPSLPESEESEEPPPPPYWQAVGLSGPLEHLSVSPATTPQRYTLQTDGVHLSANPANTPPSYTLQTNEHLSASPANTPPSYTHQTDGATYSNRASRHFDSNIHNKPELLHSFPIIRQQDARSPMPVALSWNCQRICIADRSNRKIKFFNWAGIFIAEKCFDVDIYDVGFLEVFNNEARYIVSVPKLKTVLIISISGDNSTKLVKTIYLNQQYTSICKGAIEQTLLGADALPKIGPTRVDIIDYSGSVLRSFIHIRFSYPKSIEVFQDHIVVADWKLNVVCVFLDDGTLVGQYSGTPTTPLIRPVDLTLDQFGNIMIVDGELSNIHVIDLRCAPIDVIEVPKYFSGTGTLKLAAFDVATRRLVVSRSTGHLAIFKFKGGYNAPRQGEMTPPVSSVVPKLREPVENNYPIF